MGVRLVPQPTASIAACGHDELQKDGEDNDREGYTFESWRCEGAGRHV